MSGETDADAGPSDEELALVAEHGASDVSRALALVALAKRNDRLEELRELAEGDTGVTGS